MDKEKLEQAYKELMTKEKIDSMVWEQQYAHALKVLKVARAGFIPLPIRKHWWDVFPLGHYYCPNDNSKLKYTNCGHVSYQHCNKCNYEWATYE